MVEISEEFRAGFEAVRTFPKTPETLQEAWDWYCGTTSPPPHPYDRNAFVDDWNRTIATVSTFAAKWNLRRPDMIFHPEWLGRLRADSGIHVSSTLIHMGVRVRFATWQVVDALKEM